MADTIRGPVTRIIDGATFEINVTHIGKNNEKTYGNTEIIRIAGINAQELSSGQGQLAKSGLENKLRGKEVRCSVQTRDTYGRIVATYDILN